MAATSSSKKKREEPMIVSTIVSSGTGCSQESGSNDVIEIDGSIKEGGGQILRIAMAISCLLCKPIRVVKIRAGRSNPGLRPQHLTGIQLVARICNGKLIGDHPGSTEISFFPGPLQGGNHSADTRTAGSICLLIQIALPCVIFAKQASQLILKGGTDVDMAPTIDYIIKVFQPLIQLAGVHFDCTVVKKGFFPKGRGEVHIAVNPIQAHVNPICLMDKGTITDINIEAFISGNVPRKVVHVMSGAAQDVIVKEYPHFPVTLETKHLTEREAFGNGSGLILVARSSSGCVFGGSCVGNRNQSDVVSGVNAANELLDGLKGESCVDYHMQDQLIIFMALARGHSSIKTGPLTLHTETAIHIIEMLTEVKFLIRREPQGHCIIECDGLGLTTV